MPLAACDTGAMRTTSAGVRVTAWEVEDYFPQTKRWWLRLREKNGKVNEMPCHHKLETYLDEYIKADVTEDDRKGPLFRSAIGKTGQLSDRPMLRGDVWRMVRRRAGCPTHSRVSNVWDQESVKLLGLPLIPKAGMSGAPGDNAFGFTEIVVGSGHIRSGTAANCQYD